MNRHLLFTLLCWLLGRLSVHCQDLPPHPTLEVAFHMTTSLIFPYAIQSVDCGSGDVLAQVPQAVSNVLLVKAARAGFQETNLTVITADGRLYAFPVHYNAHPARTLWRLEAPQAASIFFTEAALNQRQLARIAQQLTGDERFLYGPGDRAGGIRATLEGVYTRGPIIFYRVVLTNSSPVAYEVDLTRFTVRDRKRAKRTATQEAEPTLLYTYGQVPGTLLPAHRKVLVFALEKHSLSRQKELVLNMFEKNGGRHLELKIRARNILQACPLRLPEEPPL